MSQSNVNVEISAKRVEKLLGKIDFAEYGKVSAYPFLMGIQLGFSLEGGGMGVMDGGKYTVNVSKSCEWKDRDRSQAITATVEKVEEILTKAKVNYVSELVGKPVEVTLENDCFKDFRILTEVL